MHIFPRNGQTLYSMLKAKSFEYEEKNFRLLNCNNGASFRFALPSLTQSSIREGPSAFSFYFLPVQPIGSLELQYRLLCGVAYRNVLATAAAANVQVLLLVLAKR